MARYPRFQEESQWAEQKFAHFFYRRVSAAGGGYALYTMWELLVVGVVVWLMILVFALALCRMAAIGDADVESSRRDLSYRPAWQSWQSDRRFAGPSVPPSMRGAMWSTSAAAIPQRWQREASR